MVDLKGIDTVCDVSVEVVEAVNNNFRLRFSASRPDEIKIVQKDLQDNGISAVILLQNLLNVESGNYDRYQLAERIASSLEERGLRVQRLVTPPGAMADKSATQKIQSFILK
jgi:hypothetical protein